MTTDDNGFLSRWSRRKRAAGGPAGEGEEDASSDLAAPVAEDDAAGGDAAARKDDGAPPAEPETDAEILSRLGLPDPETLKKGDDFSGFMAAAVPEHLRRRALRRLWRSNPTLAVLDGLNDYDDDFTGGFVPPGTLKTAYEVGRGLLKRAADAPGEGGTAPREETGSAERAEAGSGPAEDAAAGDANPAAPEAGESDLAEAAAETEHPARAARRRIRFEVPETE